MDNQSRMLSERLDRLIQGMDNQSRMLSQRLDGLIQGTDSQSRMLSQQLDRLIQGASTDVIMPVADRADVIELIERMEATSSPTSTVTQRLCLPDYPHGTLQSEEFRDVICDAVRSCSVTRSIQICWTRSGRKLMACSTSTRVRRGWNSSGIRRPANRSTTTTFGVSSRGAISSTVFRHHPRQWAVGPCRACVSRVPGCGVSGLQLPPHDCRRSQDVF
jgi:hypothetical protein